MTLPEERVEQYAAVLEELQRDLRGADEERLGFWFEDGRFSFVRPAS